MASSELELTIEALVRNFYNYAEKNGKDGLMTKEEFCKMETEQLQHILTNTDNKEAFDKLIKRLNADDDGKISFEDYWTLIARSRPIEASGCSELGKAIKLLEGNFYTYAKRNGKDNMMDKKEFRRMLTEQLQHILTNTENKEGFENLIEKLEMDKHGKISIDHYWTLIDEIARKRSNVMALQL